MRYGVQGQSTQTMSVSGGHIMVSSLILSTTYSIEVAGVNSAGTGVYSHSTYKTPAMSKIFHDTSCYW